MLYALDHAQVCCKCRWNDSKSLGASTIKGYRNLTSAAYTSIVHLYNFLLGAHLHQGIIDAHFTCRRLGVAYLSGFGAPSRRSCAETRRHMQDYTSSKSASSKRTKLVLDDGNLLPVVGCKDMVDQSSLA